MIEVECQTLELAEHRVRHRVVLVGPLQGDDHDAGAGSLSATVSYSVSRLFIALRTIASACAHLNLMLMVRP
jgi:hypothetical protein